MPSRCATIETGRLVDETDPYHLHLFQPSMTIWQIRWNSLRFGDGGRWRRWFGPGGVEMAQTKDPVFRQFLRRHVRG